MKIYDTYDVFSFTFAHTGGLATISIEVIRSDETGWVSIEDVAIEETIS